MDYIQHYISPLGPMTMCSDGNALTGLWFDGQAYFASTLSADHEIMEIPVLAQTAAWLDVYFHGGVLPNTPPIQLTGTAFQRKVWHRLQRIPYGNTVSYRDIALDLCSSPRAVGSAVGRNPVSILVPCHRVVGVRGQLTGYAGGIDRKAALLRIEGITL